MQKLQELITKHKERLRETPGYVEKKKYEAMKQQADALSAQASSLSNRNMIEGAKFLFK